MSDQQCPGIDSVCPLGVVMPDGSVPVIRHTASHGYQMGELRPLKDGKPIHGAIVEVAVKSGQWCPMKPVISPSNGPIMVNSAEYRDGWTNIFGHQTYGVA